MEVAPELLGWTLRHHTDEGVVAVELTEVEAYMGTGDPASHAFRGMTKRNQVMFGEAGHLYVYRSHGLHWCCNVVTGTTGHASAVLLRAGRVVDGWKIARKRRTKGRSDHQLARGPGSLCQALGINGEHNGVDLFSSETLTLHADDTNDRLKVAAGPRVGVSRGHQEPWRFWIEDEPSVSAYRQSTRLRK